ncbi:MAG: hypothetical protein WAL98_09820 [Desulfatiglandaceae bacterium]
MNILILKLKVVRLQEKTLVPEQWFTGFQWYTLSLEPASKLPLLPDPCGARKY